MPKRKRSKPAAAPVAEDEKPARVTLSTEENINAWRVYMTAAILGWLQRGILGPSGEIAAECAALADDAILEEWKRISGND